MKKKILAIGVAVALAACSQQQPERKIESPPAGEAPAVSDVPAGEYTLDKSHASLLFRVDHLGFSNYTARFKRFDARLTLDPANLAQASVAATVDATSIETDFPDPATLDFNEQLRGEQWLHTAQFPQMTFRSTSVELTGPAAMRIHGDLTLRGVVRPIVLEATFNGGYSGHPMDPNARAGFSAHGTLRRSEFGMGLGVPPPGSRFGVGDEVEVIIEAEFSGPPRAAATTQVH